MCVMNSFIHRSPLPILNEASLTNGVILYLCTLYEYIKSHYEGTRCLQEFHNVVQNNEKLHVVSHCLIALPTFYNISTFERFCNANK